MPSTKRNHIIASSAVQFRVYLVYKNFQLESVGNSEILRLFESHKKPRPHKEIQK